MARILVVGAGIGGLATTLSLTRAGHDVTLAERAAGPTAMGAGLLLQPGATRHLASWGIEALEFAQPLRAIHLLGPTGRRRGSAPTWPGAGPRLGCARQDLHAALLAAIGEHAEVRWGAAVTGLVEAAGHVTCALGSAERRFDLVVGADGIRSTVRRAIGLDVPLRYAGASCWRALVAAECGSDGFEAWQGANQWGVFPAGIGRSYVFATSRAPASSTGAGWPASQLRCDSREPAAVALAAAAHLPADRVMHHDLFELSAARWGTARVLLLGDAAHAMTPNLGAGAAAAIADARALANALEPGLDGVAGRYGATRRASVAALRLGSRALGRVARLC